MADITGELIQLENDKYIPFGYATIKGKPFTNLAPLDKPTDELFSYISGVGASLSNGNMTLDSTSSTNYVMFTYIYGIDHYKPNTTYTVVLNITSNSLTVGSNYFSQALKDTIFINDIMFPKTVGTFKYVVTTRSDLNTTMDVLRTVLALAETGKITYSFMILEGDYTNQPIPRNFKTFEVTRGGKNLLPNYTAEERSVKVKAGERVVSKTIGSIELKQGVTYTMSRKFTVTGNYDTSNTAIGLLRFQAKIGDVYEKHDVRGDSSSTTFTPTATAEYTIDIYGNSGGAAANDYSVEFYNIQLDIGNQATAYVSYEVPLNTPTRIPLLNGYNNIFANQSGVTIDFDWLCVDPALVQFSNDYGAYGTVSVKTRPYRDLARWDLPNDDLFDTLNGNVVNGVCSIPSQKTNTIAFYNYGLSQYKPNTKYSIVVNVLSNTASTLFRLNYQSVDVSITDDTLEIPSGFVGQKKFVFTTRKDISKSTVVMRSYLQPSATPSGNIQYSFSIYEGDYTKEIFPDDLGYNAFDINKVKTINMPTQGFVRNNNDGTISVQSTTTSSSLEASAPNKLKDYIGDLPVGTLVTFTMDTTGPAKYVYLMGVNWAWVVGETRALTQEMLDSIVYFSGVGVSTQVVTLSNIKFTVCGGFKVIHSGKNLAPLDKPSDELFNKVGGATLPTCDNDRLIWTPRGDTSLGYKYNSDLIDQKKQYTIVTNVFTNTLNQQIHIVTNSSESMTCLIQPNALLSYGAGETGIKKTLCSSTGVDSENIFKTYTGADSGSITYSFMILIGDYTNKDTPYESYKGETLYVPMNTGYRFPLWKGTNQLFSTQDGIPLTVTTGDYVDPKEWYATDYINIDDYYRITTNLGYVGNMAKEKVNSTINVTTQPITLQTTTIATPDTWNVVENDLDDLARKLGYNGKVKQNFTVGGRYIDYKELNAIENSIEFYYNKVKEE